MQALPLIVCFALALGLLSLLVRRPGQLRSSWPTWLLLPIAIALAVPMGVAMNDPFLGFRLMVFALVFVRWAVALLWREQNRGWLFYLAALLAAQLLIGTLATLLVGKG